MNSIGKTFLILIGAALSLNNAAFADDHRSRSSRSGYSKQRSGPPARKSTFRSTPPRYTPVPVYPHYYKPGYRVSRPLPRGASRIVVDRSDYYFYDGYFYRPFQSGYVIVDAPIGAVVTTLPRLHHRVSWRGAPYFVVGNTFYRPHSGGYIVVNNPGVYLHWRY